METLPNEVELKPSPWKIPFLWLLGIMIFGIFWLLPANIMVAHFRREIASQKQELGELKAEVAHLRVEARKKALLVDTLWEDKLSRTDLPPLAEIICTHEKGEKGYVVLRSYDNSSLFLADFASHEGTATGWWLQGIQQFDRRDSP